MIDRYADIVLKNGVIYTADAKDTVCQAVAVKGDKIVFTGSDSEVQSFINQSTQFIDLKGKMVIPGMIDTHIHPPGLSLAELYEVQLFSGKGVADYATIVKEFIPMHPDTSLIYGRGWSWAVLRGDESTKGPRKEYLDTVAKDIPIVLRAYDGHTLWVNSKALEVNGITRDTPAPEGGIIEKDPITGELWGTFKESAMSLISLPEYSIDQYIDAMLAFQAKMHSYGITGILCMASLPFEKIFKAFAEMEKADKLALRVGGAMFVSPKDNLTDQFASINKCRNAYKNSPLLKVISAKFFTDGVIEGGTSYLLEPYLPGAGKGENYYGEFLWDIDELKQAFYIANKNGLSIHVHSTGDASTKKVLDTLGYAQAKVPGEHRNVITHLQLVAKEDIPRFKHLNVIASVQPYWHFKGPNWWLNVDHKFLGERAENEFPLQSFFASDVIVTSSSDYPATIVPNPLLAIDIGVTRNIDNGNLHGVKDIDDMDDGKCLLNKEERATIRQMIRSFTINSAYTLFMEKTAGSIEPGKLADLVVLDRDLFTINPVDIDKTKVDMTFFAGKLVYSRN